MKKGKKRSKDWDFPVGTWWDKTGKVHLPPPQEKGVRFVTPEAKKHKELKFWARLEQCTTTQTKLILLREYADQVKYKRNEKELRKMRHSFDLKKKEIFLGSCRVCREPADVRHHIVQLQNGGRNKDENIMLLCNDCHAEVHPWLKKDLEHETR